MIKTIQNEKYELEYEFKNALRLIDAYKTDLKYFIDLKTKIAKEKKTLHTLLKTTILEFTMENKI